MRPTVTRIWLVEDDSDLRRTFETWLRKSISRCEVLPFSSVEPADYLLDEQGPPDALTLDHGLPGEQGLDWLLRRRDALAATRTVLLTGNASPELSARACFASVPLVIKPQTPSWLVAFLERGGSEARCAGDPSLDAVTRHTAQWSLTPVQTAIVRLSCDGLRGPEIAREMRIKPSTLKTHVNDLLRRADCTDLREVVETILKSDLESLRTKLR